MRSSCDPPFQDSYKSLSECTSSCTKVAEEIVLEECELPLIDLSMLSQGGEIERENCKREIAKASKEWGFFQVVNHGISHEVLKGMRNEQVNIFKMPFHEKDSCFSAGTYRWGTPSANCLHQFSWSEVFHVPVNDIWSFGANTTLSSTMEQFATTVSDLAQRLAEILAEQMGHKSSFFKENCSPSTCYLRMNRYPPCPISVEALGLMPHTDSDFLTILYQDHIGGLQLVKDGKWIAVKPNPQALIVNIGDLFQAWSNDIYKSVEHRVVTNKLMERFSTAYFFCPSLETIIQSCGEPSVYRTFSFREFRHQVQHDVDELGYKIGLPRFII